MADQYELFKDAIAQARSSKTPLRIRGAGTKDWLGNELRGTVLPTQFHQGIVQYQPDELVITVKAGTPVKEVLAELASKDQQFAFDPPVYENATIGGMVCSGLAGPGRISVGNLRDFVLGVTVMDGRGDVLKFGGTVMKNVAGYDISRLLPGSMGTLALLLDVSIKVLPKPAASATVNARLSQEQAIRLSNTLASQPWPINASSWQGQQEGTLHLRLNGAKAAVQSAISAFKEYGMQTVNESEAALHWQGLREQSHPWFNPELKLWRFALPPTTPPLAIAQDCLVEWHGGQRWVQGELDYASWSQKARELGGHLSLFRASDRSSQLRASLKDSPKTQALHLIENRLRQTFDPEGVFATGRIN